MEILNSIFSAVAKYSGLTSIVSYGGLLATYYGYKALGWSFLVATNHFFAWMIGSALMFGLVALVILLVFKVGMWIKGLFGSKD